MDFDEFTGRVQHRLELPSTGESVRAIRATLTTLGERLQPGEAKDLAGPLPMEIDRFLLEAESGQRFDWDEFLDRVWERENMTDPDDRADAAFHARAILEVVADAVPPTEMEDVRDGLPADEGWDSLFELVDRE
jgi:uncharacterized protein (DUF2267 family)